MCTGIEIALLAGAAALSAGGAYVSSNESSKNQQRIVDARNRELQANMRMNRKLNKESRGLFNERVDDAGGALPRQEELTADRTAGNVAAVDTAAPEAAPLSGSAPDVVKSDVAKQMLGATTAAKESAKAQGKLGGFGDLWIDQDIANADTSRRMAIPANFVQGNLTMLPHLQDYASTAAYRPSSGIGEAMMGAGSVMGMAAGSGKLGPKKPDVPVNPYA
jgi:hypothetical protein